jgi:hypothetical protein
VNVAFEDPANARVLRYLGRAGGPNHSAPPSVYELHANALGTHPDLADRLWRGLTALLPEDCAWVVHGRPVLVRPSTGIVFGFALGTHTYGLKLRPPEYDAAIALGARRMQLDVPWILGEWRAEEPAWCLAAWRQAGDQP